MTYAVMIAVENMRGRVAAGVEVGDQMLEMEARGPVRRQVSFCYTLELLYSLETSHRFTQTSSLETAAISPVCWGAVSVSYKSRHLLD